MLSEVEARIYLSDQRGSSQLDSFRSYYTFNFGSYHQSHRDPFGRLTALNDETIKAGATLSYKIEQDSVVILLPLVGDLKYECAASGIGTVSVGRLLMLSAKSGETLHITNPYRVEFINLLYIYVATSVHFPLHRISDISIDENPNQLVHVASPQHQLRLSLGKFAGRFEDIQSIMDSTKGAFVFVIDGAFEVEDRLLQSRDGLSIVKTTQIEFESLSEEAIILIIEAI